MFNTSTFAAAALGSGGDGTVWKASVVHQALSNCPFGSTSSCAIIGGSFSLSSSGGAQLAGSFTGGTVTPVSQQTPCGNQLYDVAGTLATTSGPAPFSATLTRFHRLVFGTCVTYFATISGSLKLPGRIEDACDRGLVLGRVHGCRVTHSLLPSESV